MTLSPDYRQMLRAAGLLTVASVAAFLPFCTAPASPLITTLLLAGLVALFWRSTRLAAALAATQTAASALVLMPSLGRPEVLTYVGAALGFQVFGLAADALAHREARARADLALALDTLAQAQSRRLAQARQDERLDIARDLHDELGHGLIALLLTLSAADRAATEADLKVDAPMPRGWRRDCWTAFAQWSARCASRSRPPSRWRRPCRTWSLPSPIAGSTSDWRSTAATTRWKAATHRRCCAWCRKPSPTPCGTAGMPCRPSTFASRGQPRAGLTVAVRDNGSGSVTVTPGNGLKGMRERLARLGGSIRWASSDGGGFQLEAELPGGRAP